MVRLRVFENKTNKQLSVAIPRKSFPFLKDGKKPKFIDLDEEDFHG